MSRAVERALLTLAVAVAVMYGATMLGRAITGSFAGTAHALEAVR